MAEPNDLDDLHRVWWSTEPADEPKKHNPWFSHVLQTGTMVVVEVEHRVVGFAGYRRVGNTGVISDCFVEPGFQGAGVGTRLLAAVVDGISPVMTLASDHARAAPLYRRYGMEPIVACHYVAGQPSKVPRGVPVQESPFYPVDVSDLPHLRGGLGCTFLQVSDSLVAVTRGSIESSWVAPNDDPMEVIASAVGYLADMGSREVEIQLGEDHAALTWLLEVGFRITFSDTLMASPEASVPDTKRITFNGDFLRISRD